MASVAEYESPDGRLRLLVQTGDDGDDGDATIGFAGRPWHTHGTILAATSGLPEDEALRQFLRRLCDGSLAIVVFKVAGDVRDVWVSDDPAADAHYAAEGESVELRRWDGGRWAG
jgi:hypothetical protein